MMQYLSLEGRKPKCDKIIPEEDQRWKSKRCGIYAGKSIMEIQEKALESFILQEEPSKCSRICLRVQVFMDIGCGPGMQTIDLSRLTDGTIMSIDNHPQFLEDLRQKIEQNGLTDRITPYLGDMCDLHFEKGIFDIIWSEGSIYIIGFEKGFLQWRAYLKDKGYLVASELPWLRPDAPEVVKDYFSKEYPSMQDIKGNLSERYGEFASCKSFSVHVGFSWPK